MKRIFTVMCCLAFAVSSAKAEDQPRKRRQPAKITREKVDQPVLRAQILLDRASFSPGEIDAAYGPNLRSAIRGFQVAHHLSATGELGPETWVVLNMDTTPVLILYEISQEDVAGSFQASLPVEEGVASSAKISAVREVQSDSAQH